MISDEAADRAESWIREALAEGARALTDVRREGRLLWPVVLTDTRPDMKVMCREAFAPLVSVVRYRSFDDGAGDAGGFAVRPAGRASTRTICKKAFKAVAALDVGGVMVNDTSIFRVDQMPYGGNRMSGIGREGVRFAIEEMTNLKLVCFNLNES